MAVGKDEAIPVGPIGMIGVDDEVFAPQHRGDVCHTHRRSGMTRLGLLDGVHCQTLDGVGEQVQISHIASLPPTSRCYSRAERPPDVDLSVRFVDPAADLCDEPVKVFQTTKIGHNHPIVNLCVLMNQNVPEPGR